MYALCVNNLDGVYPLLVGVVYDVTIINIPTGCYNVSTTNKNGVEQIFPLNCFDILEQQENGVVIPKYCVQFIKSGSLTVVAPDKEMAEAIAMNNTHLLEDENDGWIMVDETKEVVNGEPDGFYL